MRSTGLPFRGHMLNIDVFQLVSEDTIYSI